MSNEILNNATKDAMHRALDEFNTLTNINTDYWDHLSGRKFSVNISPQPLSFKSRFVSCLVTMAVPKDSIDSIISSQSMDASQVKGEYPRAYLESFIDRVCALLNFEQFKQIIQAIVDGTNKRLNPEVISVNPYTSSVENPALDNESFAEAVKQLAEFLSQEPSYWREESNRNQLARLMATLLREGTDFQEILDLLDIDHNRLSMDHFAELDNVSSMWKSLINFCFNTGTSISQNAYAQIAAMGMGQPPEPSLINSFLTLYSNKHPENMPNTDENNDE